MAGEEFTVDKAGDVWVGEERVAHVFQVPGYDNSEFAGLWRAQRGDPAEPESYAVVYEKTRKAAVEGVLK